MVDSMANSTEDLLIDSFQFKIPPGASYVTDRRNVSYFTSGSNIYQSNSGAKVARITLSGDGWLDPSTVRLHYTLTNNDITTRFLRPIGGPWSFFRRVRVMCGGALIEDIDYYNRTHEMFDILTSANNRSNAEIEGFGIRWDSPSSYGNYTLAQFPGINGGLNINTCFKPLCGIFAQTKYIPLMWCPITLEFEIVSNSTDAITSPIFSGTFTPTNTSTSWQIQDLRMLADVVTLDNGLQNSYAEHVLSGKSLPINYSTYVSILQSVTMPVINVSVTRAVSRLKSVFVSFDENHSTIIADTVSTSIMKDWNSFIHPMKGTYDSTKELEFQMQIGPKMFPEYPCRSLAQSFYELKKSLGIASSSFHSIAITRAQYMNDHFIIGFDTEKIIEAGFSGLNSKAGDLMSIRVKSAGSTSLSDSFANATKMYITLHTDNILEIRDTGVQVFD